MNKQTRTKIISGLIVLSFVVSFLPFSSPLQAVSQSNLSELYSSPNQYNGNNPYKFKVSDVVNSSLLTSVVGCTGVVNKVSAWMSKFIQSPKQQARMAIAETAKIREQLKNACASVKASTETGADSIPTIGGLSKAVGTIFANIKASLPGGGTVKMCQEQVDTTSEEMIEAAIEEEKRETEKNDKEQCFDGIALTLARNQLTAMTRSAMNWVNSGYGGNPFFVQNMQNFTNAIENNVIETGIDVLLSPGNENVYARDFARTKIVNRGIVSSSSRFLGGLQSSLESFITDPSSYYTDENLNDADATQRAIYNSRVANNIFANDFSTGGWNGWLALTQRDQNNPLGFTMLANQYLTDTQTQQVVEKKEELTRNNGFLNQETCVQWQEYDDKGKPKRKVLIAGGDIDGGDITSSEFVYNNVGPTNAFNHCSKWKTITPGSIVQEKTTNYLNSPERQLELAKTINDSLNALFSVLISKLQGGGLSGLSDSVVNTNWTDNLNSLSNNFDGNTPYDNKGAYDGFNLTRDLGNTYIHSRFESLGKWDARNNCILVGDNCPAEIAKRNKLYSDLPPGYYDAENNFIPYNSNSYYTVSVAGKTRIIKEGYNGWEVGDRAFWNGTEWQNWKKGQANPVKKRGVIQIQQDYIVAAKEILKVLPTVMTNLGQLDYCLPGPNPSYKSNSTSAQSAYQDWIGSMYVGPRDEHRTEWRIDHEDSRTYRNLMGIFTDNPNTWLTIRSSNLMSLIDNFDRNWLKTTNDSKTWAGKLLKFVPQVILYKEVTGMRDVPVGACAAGGGTPGNCLTYHYEPNTDERVNIDNRKKVMEDVLDEVNNYLFQNFYKVFDVEMNKNYFKKMTDVYNDTEVRVGLDKNLAYIPMAESGFDLTKNITYYNDDITKITKEYNDAISQARINVSKLEPIRNEVSGIIAAAQGRRDANLLKILNDEAKRTGGTVLTEAQYKVRYAGCLEEENISFYDPEEITGMSNVNDENCTDGIDNDLNGLIDKKDPKCPGYIDPNNDELRTTGNRGGSEYRR